MRPTRNPLIAATVAFAAMAMLATPASARTIEVIDESTGTHCSDIVEETGHDISGGCEVTATGSASTLVHTGASEVVTSQCNNAFTANVSGDDGYIDTDANAIQEDEGAGCIVDECVEAGEGTELEWPISGMFEYGGGQEEMVVTFCIAAHGGPDTACTVLVDVAQDHPTDAFVFTASSDPCHENPATELTGQWTTTSGDIEVNHVHYPTD